MRSDRWMRTMSEDDEDELEEDEDELEEDEDEIESENSKIPHSVRMYIV